MWCSLSCLLELGQVDHSWTCLTTRSPKLVDTRRLGLQELGDVPCGGVPAYETIHNNLTNILWSDAYVTSDQIIAEMHCSQHGTALTTACGCHFLFPVVSNRNVVPRLENWISIGDMSRKGLRLKSSTRLSQFQAGSDQSLKCSFSGIDILLKASSLQSTAQMFDCY